jgi:hypothetical protein
MTKEEPGPVWYWSGKISTICRGKQADLIYNCDPAWCHIKHTHPEASEQGCYVVGAEVAGEIADNYSKRPWASSAWRRTPWRSTPVVI